MYNFQVILPQNIRPANINAISMHFQHFYSQETLLIKGFDSNSQEVHVVTNLNPSKFSI